MKSIHIHVHAYGLHEEDAVSTCVVSFATAKYDDLRLADPMNSKGSKSVIQLRRPFLTRLYIPASRLCTWLVGVPLCRSHAGSSCPP